MPAANPLARQDQPPGARLRCQCIVCSHSPISRPHASLTLSSSDDARSGRRVHASSASSRAPGLVKGEASHRSGRQTDYRRKAGRRVNTDMGESSGRLDGRRGGFALWAPAS